MYKGTLHVQNVTINNKDARRNVTTLWPFFYVVGQEASELTLLVNQFKQIYDQ